MALIEIEKLVKLYGYVPALRGIDLAVERGECVTVIGANGSGKSTLIRLLCGLSKPTSGAIRIGGWTIPGEAESVRAQIGLVAHKPLLYEGLTGRENLTFFARLYGANPDRVEAMLQRVGLSKRAGDPARTYSRGMMQRLSLARALLHEPDVLLFDEPYTGLDADSSATLDAIILESRAEGRTLMMALHDFERAARLSSRIIVLARGKVAHDSAQHGAVADAAALAAIYTAAGESAGVTNP